MCQWQQPINDTISVVKIDLKKEISKFLKSVFRSRSFLEIVSKVYKNNILKKSDQNFQKT